MMLETEHWSCKTARLSNISPHELKILQVLNAGETNKAMQRTGTQGITFLKRVCKGNQISVRAWRAFIS